MFEADRGCGGNRWPVVRLRASSTTEVVLLSERFFCLTTHWNRCTVCCCGDGCSLCDLLPSRGLFYLAGMCGGRCSIVELGAMSASHLEEHLKLLHGGMRAGLVIELSRRTSKGPVHTECLREQAGCVGVSMLDLASHVLAVYKFPPPNPGDRIDQYEVRVRQIARVRNELAATRLVAGQKSGV